MQMTEDEARRAIEAELEKKNITERLSPAERAKLTAEMYSRFDFSSKSIREKKIRIWIDKWQSRKFGPL